MIGPKPSPRAVPLYTQIANDLRKQIKDGYYGPGALLPSRNEIATMYGVSPITARDSLAVLSHEGYAQAVRGRGHIVRRQRPRITLPHRLYTQHGHEPGVELRLHQLDVYQETPPDNIALPLESGTEPVWVRRAVWMAATDRQSIHIHVSWLLGLGLDATAALREADPETPWPQTVQQLTGRTVAFIQQNTRARGANPFEASTFTIPPATTVFVSHLTTYDPGHQPIEHSRHTWPTDAVRTSDHYAYGG
jgi:GntR family transcriptional regulator